MKIYDLNFKFKTMPEIFLRGEHVQAVIKDENGKFLLGKKNIYPEGISRFVGGGLEEENPLCGMVRELEEELCVKIRENRLVPLAKIVCHIQHTQNIVFTTHLFFVKITQPVIASSDLDGLKYLDEGEFNQLIENYQNLTDSSIPKFDYSWADYGQVFAQIHQIGLDRVKELGL